MLSPVSKSEMDVIDEKVKAFVQSMLEHHLVNIRVFITKTEEGQAKLYDYGGGDWYAIYGGVREWLIKQDERSKEMVRAESKPEPEDSL